MAFGFLAAATQAVTEVKEVAAVEQVKSMVTAGVDAGEALLKPALAQDPQAMAALQGIGDALKGTVSQATDMTESAITGQSGISPQAVVGVAKAANALGL